MNTVDFFEGLPKTGEMAPIPEGRPSHDMDVRFECVEGPNNCANCDCSGVNDCHTDCASEC